MKKLAILLPGFLDSPNYLHMRIFRAGLEELGYVSVTVDPCNIWLGGADISKYTVTNYIRQILEIINSNADKYDNIVLVGHSLGGFTAIIAAEFSQHISKLVAVCPPRSSKQ